MPVPSTNTKFSEIQTEFGGTNPIQLSEYYSGGPLVPASTPAPNGPIPSSGQISVGQFRASAKALEADYLVISGGGGGSTPTGGGSGAGGVRFSDNGPAPLNTGTKLSLSPSTVYPVVVGGGGVGGFYKPPVPATRGSDSIFNPGGTEGVNMITTEGGGTESDGIDGGSGGGRSGGNANPGGLGNTPPFSPPQGQNGGDGVGPQAGAGGGGTGAAGNPGGSPSGDGGAGVPVSLPGSPTYYGGGGGCGSDSRGIGSRVGSGGIGGGGGGNGGNGTAGTGGGGGGGFFHPDGGPESLGGSGGSGQVKIRVPACAAPLISVSPPTNTVTPHPGGGSVANFTVSGNLTIA